MDASGIHRLPRTYKNPSILHRCLKVLRRAITEPSEWGMGGGQSQQTLAILWVQSKSQEWAQWEVLERGLSNLCLLV